MSKTVHDRTHEEQIAGRCVHFNGVMHRTCRAGVVYDELSGRDDNGHRVNALPCLKGPAAFPGKEVATCPQLRWPTPEEVRAEKEESDRHVKQFLDDLAANRCPHCHQPVTRKRQVGRCVYGEPCGHRLYQGRA